MGIETGMRFPDAEVIRDAGEGFETVSFADYVAGRKVVVFALPGAFTGTCSTIHLPSFMRTADAFRDKGIDEIICVSVNDPFVLRAWGKESGAADAGISFLADAEAKLTEALGMAFSAPPVGLYGRSNRYAAVLDDGVVTIASVDDPGVCDVSTGDRLLEAVDG